MRVRSANRPVEEAMPATGAAAPAQALEFGTFHGILRPTEGTEVDLAKYRADSAWRKRFSYNFGAAPLTPEQAVSQK